MARPLNQRENFKTESAQLRRMLNVMGTDVRLSQQWRSKAARLVGDLMEHLLKGERVISPPKNVAAVPAVTPASPQPSSQTNGSNTSQS